MQQNENSSESLTISNTELLMTVADVAYAIHRTTATVRNWERTGKLPAALKTISGQRLFRRQDVERLLQELGSSGAAA